jgi:small conductance mechanosensitive channel
MLGLLTIGVFVFGVPTFAAPPDDAPEEVLEGEPESSSTAVEPEEVAPPDPDTALAARLRALFREVPSFSDIDVEVRSGVVKLSGEVPSADIQKAAVQLAERMPGAVFVYDRLQVAVSVEKRVAPAIAILQSRSRDLVARLPILGIGIGLLIAFWYGSHWLSRILFHRRLTGNRPLVVGLVQSSVRGGLFVIGLILVLDLLDLTTIVGAMLGTAGILGVALGFAFRDIVENYLASIILTFRQPFARGDLIEVSGHQGRVQRLTLRETVLVTADGNHVRVPNSTVFKSVIQNYTTNPVRRFSFKVAITADADLPHALDLVRNTLRETEGVLVDPPPTVTVDAFGETSISLNMGAWVNQREVSFGSVRTTAMQRVKGALDAAGIGRPQATMKVFTAPLVDGDVPLRPRTASKPTEPADSAEPPEIEDLIDREAAGEVNLLKG